MLDQNPSIKQFLREVETVGHSTDFVEQVRLEKWLRPTTIPLRGSR